MSGTMHHVRRRRPPIEGNFSREHLPTFEELKRMDFFYDEKEDVLNILGLEVTFEPCNDGSMDVLFRNAPSCDQYFGDCLDLGFVKISKEGAIQNFLSEGWVREKVLRHVEDYYQHAQKAIQAYEATFPRRE